MPTREPHRRSRRGGARWSPIIPRLLCAALGVTVALRHHPFGLDRPPIEQTDAWNTRLKAIADSLRSLGDFVPAGASIRLVRAPDIDGSNFALIRAAIAPFRLTKLAPVWRLFVHDGSGPVMAEVSKSERLVWVARLADNFHLARKLR